MIDFLLAEGNAALRIFILAFLLSAFAGLAALMRTSKRIRAFTVIASMLNSGLMGLAVACLWYTNYQTNIYFLIGICILTGMGGIAFVEFSIVLFRACVLSVVKKIMSAKGFKIEFSEDLNDNGNIPSKTAKLPLPPKDDVQ